MSFYEPVPKSLGYRLHELSQSLQVINDSLEAIREGGLYQLVPLYGQLRSLLTEKSSGNEPLLSVIAEQLNQDLKLFWMPTASDDMPEVMKSALFRMGGFPVSLEKELPKQESITINAFLDKPIVFFEGREYTVRELITFFANKAGGAHYAPDFPKHFARMLSIGLFGQPALKNALRQIGEITLELGLELLREIASVDLHLTAYVDEESIEEKTFLIDHKASSSQMRMFFGFNQGRKPCFGITTMQGISCATTVKRLLNWSKPHHWHLSLYVRDDLSTRLSIHVDGVEHSSTEVPRLLFVSNRPTDYETYVNRSHDDDQKRGVRLGLGQMLMLKRQLNPVERARVMLHFEEGMQKEDADCIYFSKSGFGHASVGETDLTMEGRVIKWKFQRLIDGDFPEDDET